MKTGAYAHVTYEDHSTMRRVLPHSPVLQFTHGLLNVKMGHRKVTFDEAYLSNSSMVALLRGRFNAVILFIDFSGTANDSYRTVEPNFDRDKTLTHFSLPASVLGLRLYLAHLGFTDATLSAIPRSDQWRAEVEKLRRCLAAFRGWNSHKAGDIARAGADIAFDIIVNLH